MPSRQADYLEDLQISPSSCCSLTRKLKEASELRSARLERRPMATRPGDRYVLLAQRNKDRHNQVRRPFLKKFFYNATKRSCLQAKSRNGQRKRLAPSTGRAFHCAFATIVFKPACGDPPRLPAAWPPPALLGFSAPDRAAAPHAPRKIPAHSRPLKTFLKPPTPCPPCSP